MSFWRRFLRRLKTRLSARCNLLDSTHFWTSCTCEVDGKPWSHAHTFCDWMVLVFNFAVRARVAEMKTRRCARTRLTFVYRTTLIFFLWAPGASTMKSEDITSSHDMQSVKSGPAVLPFSVEALMADRTPSRADKTAGSRALWGADGSAFSFSCSVVREGDASLEAKSPERADRSSSRFSPPPSKW